MLGWLTGGIGKAAESIGDAVNKNYRTIKGDAAERDQQLHEEQLAILAQFQAEFVSRPTRTKLDSFVDALNRLPRPLLTFGIIFLFIWPIYDPGGFVDYMAAIQIIPETLWTLFLMVFAFFFTARVISEDLRKPKLSEDQRRQALEIIERRARETKAKKAEAEKPPPPKVKPPREELPPPGAIDDMIDALLAREGGYVNHPADRGGPTNCGITRSTLEAWRECPVSVDDVRNLTRAEAAEIYRAQYYFAPGIDGLPAGIQAHVFDIAVNSGPRTGVKLLQRALNRLGAGIAEDGAIGPETREAARAYPAPDINAALVKIRLDFYDSLVENDPSQAAFIVGWRKRANSFLEGVA